MDTNMIVSARSLPPSAAPPLRNGTPARAANSAGADNRYVWNGNPDHKSGDAQLQAAGKQLAMLLFTIGARDLVATQDAFDRHPAWRSQ